ncbi:hypothetical protein N0V82_001984 [Gnomoniopsis sp. IMI 355080]|nr:hypothetical protein N0V82_001984 [Gnomoniopsis sp. IMI 355080]
MPPPVFFLVAATAACLIWALWWRQTPPTAAKLDLPLVDFDGVNGLDEDALKERYTKDTGTLLKTGYNKFSKNGHAFAIRNLAHNEGSRPLVFVATKHLEEVRNAPQNRLSLPEYTERASILNHIGGPRITEEVQNAARLNLNRALNNLIGPIQTQCFDAARGILPSCQEYLNTVLKAPSAVRQKYPPWLYWTAKYFSPEIKAVMAVRKKAANFVLPVLMARQAEVKKYGEAVEKQDDFIQWLMDEYRAKGKELTADDLVQNIFITMVASMHGTSTICYSVLLNLLAHPDTAAEVKDEIERVKKHELGADVLWTRHSLGELRLLDSLMRETLRLNSFTEATMQRTAIVPYTFKDGLTVPAGFSVNFTAVQHSLDEDIHGPNAAAFDPKRWIKRRQGFDTSKFQFASTSDDWLNWGGGPHACPGRFLADIAIKLTLIYLLGNYEMKYPEGRLERPADGRRNLMITPDMTLPIMFKEASK